MNTLDKIIENKREIVSRRSSEYPISFLKETEWYDRASISLKKILQQTGERPHIISEFKRKSPSKGDINALASVADITKGYQNAGAAAISVLTDTKYFGGSNEDLMEARRTVKCPILRKDFVIDTYQIHEAKSIGADLILLIAAALSLSEIVEFSEIAHQIGLEVLLEVHDKNELDPGFFGSIDIIGVNNRNLKTFETSIQNSIEIYDDLPDDLVKISESGLATINEVRVLQEKGYQGFLIGEQFMKSSHPAEELERFLIRP